MGKSGPKRLSAAILKARGSKLALAREHEERQQHARGAPVPIVYPLPRDLSTAARQWGQHLMRELIFTPTEHRLLVEMLRTWDSIQALRQFLAVHGVSQTDKAGVVRQRPEQRALEHAQTLLLAYERRLEVKETH